MAQATQPNYWLGRSANSHGFAGDLCRAAQNHSAASTAGYKRLISEGFIGEERRIEWVDNLRTIHQENKLFGINYSIASQEDYKPAFELNPGPFVLHRSVMKLDLSMLHEGDLITMIEALKAKETTPFILRECEITRSAASTTSKLAPNSLASCELDWLTIREPQTEEAAPL